MTASDICFLTATELAAQIRAKRLSSFEVVSAHLAQIERINPQVNAIVTLTAEAAIEQARAADEALVRGDSLGPLHGLPVAHKDVFATKGVRTTQGSPIYRDFVPDEDALIVERIKRAGAVSLGKTNTPEFAAGSQTFNEVFGATLNPYDLSKTCGGSSGGAAVALACGMVPIADGSDFGGSLRNPASFCNVVGLRTSPGRVPMQDLLGWFPLSVAGPMARTVQDAALLLSAIAGPDPRSPLGIDVPGAVFTAPLERDFRGVRIAWSPSLGGLPVDRRVTAALESQRGALASLGCAIDEAEPDFGGAEEAFFSLRAWSFALRFGDLVATRRDQIKDEVIWNTEEGLKRSGLDVARAAAKQTEIYHRMRRFMEHYEFLLLPVSQVPPFDVTQRYVTSIEGAEMSTYLDWMKSCWYISLTGHPAISVPCGFTPQGLPVGLQIVGRHHDEFGVLQLAHAFEQATQCWKRRPPLAG